MMRYRLGDHGLRFDFNLDLGSLLELHVVPVWVRETVWNADLSIQVVRSLDSDLGFFGLTGTGMRMDDLFDFPWERSTCL